MDAGPLDRRVVIERATTNDDAAGEPLESWAPVAEVWSNVQPVRGNEAFAGHQRYAEVTTRFRVRFHTDVTPKDRLLYDGRLYDIVEVREIGRRLGYEVLATARAE